MRRYIYALRLHRSPQPSTDGTKIVYATQYRGVGIIIPMQRTEAGWKADVRFWLAMRKQREARPQKTDPEIVAKSFLLYILAKKPESLNDFTSERIKAEEYTAANNLPPGDLDHLLSLVIEMPIVRARPGERVVLPSGEAAIGSDAADSLLLIGLSWSTEIPFLMKRIDGAWKVVPQKSFEMLRKAGAISVKTVTDPDVRASLIARMSALTTDSARRWGRLTAHEMLCHLG